MPVKVRCECGAGISAPDAARGKTIKCKQCGSPVRVPSGGRKKAAKRKRAEPTPLDVHDEDFFSNIDMGRAEDRNVQVCPKCATEVDEEDIECPGCGINLETGELSQKKKNLKRYKGPDPDEFYKVSWGNSFQYLKDNKGVAISLCLVWSVAMTLYAGTGFMFTYSEKFPFRVFWFSLWIMCGAAPMGAFWQLWIETIKITVDGKDKLSRFEFDFFTDVVLGIKAYVWPLALNLPLLLPLGWILAVAILFGGGTAVLGSGLLLLIALPILYLTPMVCYPVAMSHMASKYAFRAYLPVHMFRITFQNFGAVGWWFLMLMGLWIITLSVATSGIYYAARIVAFFGESIAKLVEVCGISIVESERGFLFNVTFAGIAMLALFLWHLFASIFTCLPMVMLMRCNGLLAFYNARTLELGFKVVGNRPAGFWVRYLAFLIDICVVGAMYVLLSLLFYALIWMVHALELAPETIERTKDSIYWGGLVAGVMIPFLVFLLEGGPTSCTMGMRAMGLTVIQHGRKRLQSNAVMVRAVVRSLMMALSVVFPPAAFAFVMCGMNKEKQTLHDKMSGTEVVWRGENV